MDSLIAVGQQQRMAREINLTHATFAQLLLKHVHCQSRGTANIHRDGSMIQITTMTTMEHQSLKRPK